MLYIESPAGTGYSYAGDANYTVNDDEVMTRQPLLWAINGCTSMLVVNSSGIIIIIGLIRSDRNQFVLYIPTRILYRGLAKWTNSVAGKRRLGAAPCLVGQCPWFLVRGVRATPTPTQDGLFPITCNVPSLQFSVFIFFVCQFLVQCKTPGVS